MGIFDNVKKDKTVEEDRAGVTLLESAIYDATIKCAYLEPIGEKRSQKMIVILKVKDKELTDEEVVLNTEGSNTCKKDPNKLLPGFLKMNALVYLASNGQELDSISFEEKDIKIYNRKERAEQVVRRQVATGLIGRPVKVGIQHAKLSRQQQQSGVWVDTDKTYETNVVDKYFDTTGRTHAESVAAKEPEFIHTWKNKFMGKVVDKTSKKAVPWIEPTGTSGSVTTATKSIFDQNK